MKKFICILFSVLYIFSSVTTYAYEWQESGINLKVNGEKINFADQKPLLDIETSRTYVPIRFLAENLGAEVEWDSEHQVVKIVNKYIEGEDTKLVHYLKIGTNKFVTARYENSNNDVADKVNVYMLPEGINPLIMNGRTMLPFRYVAELLGAQVYYDDSDSTAYCIKRDMKKLNEQVKYKNRVQMGSPVLNTLVSQYWVEELNKYRETKGVKPLVYDSVYSDMMTWACFHQMEHPEIDGVAKDLERIVGRPFWMHMFRIEDPAVSKAYEEDERYTLYTLPDGGKLIAGAAAAYIPQFIPNSTFAKKDNNGTYIHTIGYSEVAFTAENWRLNGISWESEKEIGGRGEKRAAMYKELKEEWGVDVKLQKPHLYDNWQLIPLEKNEEYAYVSVYDEDIYREIVNVAISIWRSSWSHDLALCDKYMKETGFAWVGVFCYAGFNGYIH